MADDSLKVIVDLDTKKAKSKIRQLADDPNFMPIGQNIEKQIKGGAAKGAAAANQSLKGVQKNINFANQGILGLLGSFTKFGIVLKTVNFGFEKLTNGIRTASQFGLAIEEINTLQSRNNRINSETIRGLERTSSLYGQELITTSRAFYNTVSAGVTNSSKALNLLETASKAAVVGVTDINTAVRSLLSAVNAYGQENITATEAANQLFATVQLGRTTFPELANNIGDVIPIAAQLGVGLDELGGFFATATRTVGNTSKVATQLRQVLIKILDPTKEAQDAIDKMNKKLGDQAIQFDAVALRQKGLVRFLGEFQNALSRFEDQDKILGSVFSSSRALLGILSALGENYEEFEENTRKVNNSSGVLDAKIKDVNNTFDRQVSILDTRATNSFQNFARKIQTGLIPTMVKLNSLLLSSATNLGETTEEADELRKIRFNKDTLDVIGSLTSGKIQMTSRPLLESERNQIQVFQQAIMQQLAEGKEVTKEAGQFFESFLKGEVDVINKMSNATKKATQIMSIGKPGSLGKAFDEDDSADPNATADANRKKLEAENLFQQQKRELLRSYGFNNTELIRGFNEEQVAEAKLMPAALVGATDELMGNPFAVFIDGATGSLDTFQNVAKNMSKATRQFSVSVKKNILNGAANAMTRGFSAMGAAMATGDDAFKAGAKAILGSFGETLSQLGQGYILQGTARLFTPEPGGPGLIAAGAALSVFGGLLSAKYGGGAGASAPSGGGSTAAEGPETPEFGPETLEDRDPRTSVNITVQGDILSENNTGERLVELVNTAFNQQGVVVEQGIA